MGFSFKQLFVSTSCLCGITFASFAALSAQQSFISDFGSNAPTCMSGSTVLQVDNALAVQMKEDHSQYPNGKTYRANISGQITKLYKDETCHTHFEVTLDGSPTATVEVIYDQGFGTTPAPALGMSVQACGDYIISYQPENGYAASPDGVLIHWIHASDSASHPNGFLIMDGTLCGQEINSTAGLGPTCKNSKNE